MHLWSPEHSEYSLLSTHYRLPSVDAHHSDSTMPNQTQYIRDPSFESCSSLSEFDSDIPWFCNFGKFVENAEFLLPENCASSPRRRTVGSFDEMIEDPNYICFRMESQNTQFSLASRNRTEPPPPRMQPERNVRRVTSELIPPASISHIPVCVDRSRNTIRPYKSDAYERAQGRLGARLRRMVSFDHHSKRRSSKPYENQSPIRNTSRDAASRTMSQSNYQISPSVSVDAVAPIVIAKDETEMRLAILSREMMASQSNARTSTPPAHGRKDELKWKDRASVDRERATRLGSVLRRMVSFDHFQGRTVSRMYEMQTNNGEEVHHRIPVERRGRFRRDRDLDSQVRSMRRW